MPIFTIEAPGGKRLKIEAPDEAQALSGAEQWHAEQPTVQPARTTRPNPKMNRIGAQDWDLGSEILNGMTLGALPNAQAGMLAGVKGLRNALGLGDDVGVSDTYDRELKAAQEARRSYRGEFPITAAVGDVAGGLVTGFGLAKSGVTLVGQMANKGLANLAPRVAASAVEGGGYAAAAGFGGSEGDVSDRLRSAKDNVPLGMIGGALAPAAGDYVVGPVVNTAKNIYRGIRDPEGRAADLLIQRIMQDKQTPDALATAVEAASRAGQPEFRAIDAAGRNTQRLGKTAARAPGEFREDAAQILDTRMAGQGDRLKGFVDKALDTTGDTAFATEQKILTGRRLAAQNLYDDAYKAPAPTGTAYGDLLEKPSVQDAMRAVEKAAAEKNMPLSDLFAEVANPNATKAVKQTASAVLGPDGKPVMTSQEVIDNPTTRIPTVRGWDMIKRALDAQVDTGFRSTDAAQRYAAATVKETRDALREQLGTDVPKYREALSRYSDDASALEAIDTGRGLAKAGNPDEGIAAFRALPEGEQDFARLGYAREVGSKIDGRAAGHDKTAIFDNPNVKAKLDAVIDDPLIRAVFGDAGVRGGRTGQLGREQDMAATRRLIAGGSDTVENLLDQPPAGLLYGLGQIASGHPIRGASALGPVVSRAAQGLNERGTNAVGDFLMSNDPAKIGSLADMFRLAQDRAGRPSIGPTVFNAAVNAPRQRSEKTR